MVLMLLQHNRQRLEEFNLFRPLIISDSICFQDPAGRDIACNRRTESSREARENAPAKVCWRLSRTRNEKVVWRALASFLSSRWSFWGNNRLARWSLDMADFLNVFEYASYVYRMRLFGLLQEAVRGCCD